MRVFLFGFLGIRSVVVGVGWEEAAVMVGGFRTMVITRHGKALPGYITVSYHNQQPTLDFFKSSRSPST